MSRLLTAAILLGLSGAASPPAKPNIIVILADDIGYGDLGCYGATRARTPNLDRLAAGGLRFTDGHAASATCTPSRYALLTGEYPWRRKGTGILPGDAALIIEPGRPTLPSLLREAGYATGVVGKWHLGLGPAGGPDWNGEIKPGPLEIGFDHAFLMPATGDRVPCVYVEDRRVVGLDPADPIRVSYQEPVGDEPTGAKNPELLKMKLTRGHDQTIVDGISRIGSMTGGKAARWKDEEMADLFADRAVRFIEKNRERPFFLYLATHDIHVPRVPHPRFAGTSGMGPRGDAIHSLDATVGKVLEALDRLKLSDNTLVVFSSDNGPVLDDGYADEAVGLLGDHKPAGPLKGQKYSLYEAGTRVPFIVRWPARVKPGVSPALVCQMDLIAGFAALTGRPAPAGDGVNVLPALLGESSVGRASLVEHANGRAQRRGAWKYIPGKAPQLYDLAADLGETKNLAGEKPELVGELEGLLNRGTARNVVMIVGDDQGWGDFSFMGHPKVRTPNIDKLAAEGALFPNGYVPTALCRASLATLLTGLYAHQHKICCNDPPEGVDRTLMHPFIKAAPALPRLLATHGTRSLQTGKFWEGHFSNAGFTHGMTVKGRHGDDGLAIGRKTMQPIADFLDQGGRAPFFLWYAPMMPHEPHDPPARLLEKYGVPDQAARYWAMCEWFDETVGELLGLLERRGLSDETLVVFVVDNGWIQNPKGGFAPRSKRTPYEGGVRTPVILKWPGRTKAGKYEDLVSTVDLAPTILAACGIEAPRELPGLSLLGRAAGGAPLSRAAVFGEIFVHTAVDLETPAPNLTHRWVRRGEWKLIVPVGEGAPELYDLRRDPDEAVNRAAGEPAKVAELTRLLDAWWKGN